MLRVGLTGGIGSGKSEVAWRLAERGAVLIDADQLAREVVEPGTAGLRAVVTEFGEGVLRGDGTLDRPRLGEIVFSDPERLAALNAIVHPLVARRSAELYERASPDAIVVHDVPLLVENGMIDRFDVVVVVDATVGTRLDRLVRQRGLSEASARARIDAQADRATRIAAADFVIDNNGELSALDEQVAKLWSELRARAHR